MTPYFSDNFHVKQLQEELNSWENTPFEYDMNGIASKGYYADCASFPIAVYTNIGLYNKNVSIPKYRSVNGGSIQIDYIKNVIESNVPNVQKIWTNSSLQPIPSLIIGDIIIYQLRDRVQHLAICEGDGVGVDCWPKEGVRKAILNDSRLTRYIHSIYRVYTN